MAVFTKTYVQCDLCEQQRELPMSGTEGFYRVEAQVSRLGAAGTGTVGEKMSGKTSDICQSCFQAMQEGEWSNLFFGSAREERRPAPSQSGVPAKPITPA